MTDKYKIGRNANLGLKLPEELFTAFDWTEAGGQLEQLRDTTDPEQYARESAADFAECESWTGVVTEDALLELRSWLLAERAEWLRRHPNMIIVVVKRIGKEARAEEIGADLESMQKVVGGFIEHVTLRGPFTGLHMWVNEMGHLDKLQIADCPLYPGPIAGDYFITRLNEEGDTIGLNPGDVTFLLAVLRGEPPTYAEGVCSPCIQRALSELGYAAALVLPSPCPHRGGR